MLRALFGAFVLLRSANALTCYNSTNTTVSDPNLKNCFVACQSCAAQPCSDTVVYGIFNNTLPKSVYGAFKCKTDNCNVPVPANSCSSSSDFKISCVGCEEAFGTAVAAVAGLALSLLIVVIAVPVCGCACIVGICVYCSVYNRRADNMNAKRPELLVHYVQKDPSKLKI